MQRVGRYFESNDNPTRLIVWTPETFEQLLALPLGTEIALFFIVPGAGAIAGTLLTVNEAMRAQTREYMAQGMEMEYDFAVYLLPDDVVPDRVPDEETGN